MVRNISGWGRGYRDTPEIKKRVEKLPQGDIVRLGAVLCCFIPHCFMKTLIKCHTFTLISISYGTPLSSIFYSNLFRVEEMTGYLRYQNWLKWPQHIILIYCFFVGRFFFDCTTFKRYQYIPLLFHLCFLITVLFILRCNKD